MIPGLLPHPTYSPTSVCEALRCTRRAFKIDACQEESCPHAFRRLAEQDRRDIMLQDREAKDAREGMKGSCVST